MSSLEWCSLFRVSFIERFHCIYLHVYFSLEGIFHAVAKGGMYVMYVHT